MAKERKPSKEVVERFSDNGLRPVEPDELDQSVVVSEANDPINSAAAIAGVDPEVLEKYRGKTADEIAEIVAEQDAERAAR